MTRQKWMLLAGALGLMVAAVGVLGHSRSLHKLGPPGLKLVEQPVYDEGTNQIGSTTVALPSRVLGYRSQTRPITAMEVTWLPKDTTFARRFYEMSNAPSFWLSVILMGTDHGSIHRPKICLTGQGWQVERTEEVVVPMQRPHRYDLPVMKLTASKQVKINGREVRVRSLYVYWFVSDRQLTARHGQRIWWMARELLLTGTLPRWAYVACWAGCLPGQEDATFERMKEFLAAAVPEFQLVSLPQEKSEARNPNIEIPSVASGYGGQAKQIRKSKDRRTETKRAMLWKEPAPRMVRRFLPPEGGTPVAIHRALGSWKATFRFCACIGTVNQGPPHPALRAIRGKKFLSPCWWAVSGPPRCRCRRR